jgi:hypothetical protein
LHGGSVLVEFFICFDTAVKIGGAVAGDGGEPSGEAGDVAERGKSRQGLEKNVLHEIVDVGEGNAGEQDPVDHARVARVEKAEGGAVTPLGSADKGVIGATTEFERRIHGQRTGARGAEFKKCGHVGSMKMRNVSSGRRRETVEC